MIEPQKPFCKDCKHSREEQFYRFSCHRDVVVTTNLVTGRKEYSNDDLDCQKERNPSFFNLFACGSNAYYFEPKQETSNG